MGTNVGLEHDFISFSSSEQELAGIQLIYLLSVIRQIALIQQRSLLQCLQGK